MNAHPWLIALHVIALFVWVGHLLLTPRALAFAVTRGGEERIELIRWLRKSWNILSPAGLVVLASGLLMLFGIAMPGERSVLDYLAPRSGDSPTFWYITFHVKLVCATLLICWDFWLGAQIFRLARGAEPRKAWPLAVLMALSGALLVHLTVWLSLSALGVGYEARFFGYAGSLLMIAGGIFGARKLARSDTRGKYMAAHGLVAGLVIMIVVLVVARPLAFGGATV